MESQANLADASVEPFVTQQRFTYKHSPLSRINDRWITHDPNGHFAGEFKTEAEASAAVQRWSTNGGELVVMDWESSPEGAPESHRGTYTISVVGTKWKKQVCSGWHSMERASSVIGALRESVAAHGIDAVRAVLNAVSA